MRNATVDLRLSIRSHRLARCARVLRGGPHRLQCDVNHRSVFIPVARFGGPAIECVLLEWRPAIRQAAERIPSVSSA